MRCPLTSTTRDQAFNTWGRGVKAINQKGMFLTHSVTVL